MDSFTALLHPLLQTQAWPGWGAAPHLHLLSTSSVNTYICEKNITQRTFAPVLSL